MRIAVLVTDDHIGQHCRIAGLLLLMKARSALSVLPVSECGLASQERRRVALKLVNVTDAYFGTMTSRGWFFALFREVRPAGSGDRVTLTLTPEPCPLP